MARYYGNIGYAVTSEVSPSVWKESIIERPAYGDVNKIYNRREDGEWLNDNLIIRNQFSIVADAFAFNNFSEMKYIEWMGVKWKVSSVSVERPRLIIDIGGVYTGVTANEQ